MFSWKAYGAMVALALILVPWTGAQDPGLEDPRELPGAATAVASALDGGNFAAGNLDPYHPVQHPHQSEPVWHIWEADGSLRISGTADPKRSPDDPCSLDAQECDGDAIAIAMDGDGDRLVVASRPGGDGASLLTFITPNQGVLDRLEVDGRITTLDISEDGTRVVAGTHRNVFGSGPEGDVFSFSWTSSTITQSWRRGVDAPVTDLDLANDETVLVVAAQDHHRFDMDSGTPSTAYTNRALEGDVTAVRVASDGGGQWSVAGTSGGFFALFTQASHADPSFQEYQRQFGTGQPVSAVAITEDGAHVAVADAAGRLELYGIDPGSSDIVSRLESIKLDHAVRDLRFSGDGAYLAVATDGGVRLHAVRADLPTMFADAGSNLGAVAVDRTASQVIAASQDELRRYLALHEIELGVPSPRIEPGETLALEATLTNGGNRILDVSLSVEGPDGWGVAANVTQVELLPGEGRTVSITGALPDFEPPGEYEIVLVADAGVTNTVKTSTVTVPAVSEWAMVVEGADSKPIEAGGQATFDVKVRNLGNGEATAQLRAQATPAGWTASVASPELTLGPSQSQVVQVTVEAPDQATEGAQGVAMLAIQGTSLEKEMFATVGARFGVALDMPARIIVEPEASRSALVTVRNTGNAVDSYVVALGDVPDGWNAGLGEAEAASIELAHVDAGASRTLALTVRAPAGPMLEPWTLNVGAAGQGASDAQATRGVEVRLPEPTTTTTTTDGDEEGSALGLLALVAGLVVAVRLRRR